MIITQAEDPIDQALLEHFPPTLTDISQDEFNNLMAFFDPEKLTSMSNPQNFPSMFPQVEFSSLEESNGYSPGENLDFLSVTSPQPVLNILPEVNIEMDTRTENMSLFQNLFQEQDFSILPPVPSPPLNVVRVEEQVEAPNKMTSTRNRSRARSSTKADAKLESKLREITFPKTQLKQLSSGEIERYIKNLSSNDLSPVEKQELKKQRRQVKNRESAQLSRQKKKDYITELERKVEDLKATYNQLSTNITALTAENKTLMIEVVNLTHVIKNSPFLSNILLNLTSMVVLLSLCNSIPKSKIRPTLPVLPVS